MGEACILGSFKALGVKNLFLESELAPETELALFLIGETKESSVLLGVFLFGLC